MPKGRDAYIDGKLAGRAYFNQEDGPCAVVFVDGETISLPPTDTPHIIDYIDTMSDAERMIKSFWRGYNLALQRGEG